MRSILNEAFEWLDRAEQAREVAGQRKKSSLGACRKFRSARPSRATPAVLRRRPGKTRKEPDDFSAKQQVSLAGRKRLIENLPKEIEMTDPFGLSPDS